ncbi:transcriptional repressor LexA [Candidatus Riflebacteria bacterium]
MGLSPKQLKIFDFICHHRQKHQFSPTLKEIAGHFKLSSMGTVHKHVQSLIDQGLLKRKWNEKRGLIPAKEPGSFQSLSRLASVRVPFIGIVQAGMPIETFEQREEINIPEEMLGRGETFVLKVEGNSMIDEYIAGGDLIIVEARDTAENGEMVVATIGNDRVTLKRIYREQKRIRLQPSNPDMEPIYVTEEDLKVNGVVVGLLRKYR